MNWSQWKQGIIVSAVASLLVAGAGVAEGTNWKQFLSVFCAAMLTHGAAYLKVPGGGSGDGSKPTP